MSRPLPRVMVDLFCGRGGWTKGFQAHGWRCIGIDLYPQPDYPGEFIQADIAQLYELPEADFYCCSSPCNEFTPHCLKMWCPNPAWPLRGIAFFNHARQLLEATGKSYIMENVKCAEKFIGQATHHAGSFYLWGHVPALIPDKLTKAKWYRRPGKPGKFRQRIAARQKGQGREIRRDSDDSGLLHRPDSRCAMSTQPSLFDGKTFSPARDGARLESQLQKVLAIMTDGNWRTLAAIVHRLTFLDCRATEASVSARLRDLRKDKFGAHIVNRRHIENGLFEYQVIRRSV